MAKLGLTNLQRDILDCLAKGMSTEEVMTACNCSISSVKQTRCNKELRAYYSEACHNAIRGLVPKAIKELERLISDSSVQDSVKVSAVKQILEVSRISDIAGAVQQDINITVSYE